MLLKLGIIGMCGVAAYYVAHRLGFNGSRGLLRDPLTIALLAMAAGYGLVRATLGPLAGPLVWAEPITEVRTEAELAQVVANAGSEPVIVDFYAPWCMPCRVQAPAINTVASEGYRVAVVNVDEAKQLAWNYEVGSIPTIVVLRNGDVVARGQGVHTAEGLRALIKG
jgi:thioredoxin 1